MTDRHKRVTTSLYTIGALLCATLPLAVPTADRPVVNTIAFFLGVPLAVLALLMAAVDRLSSEAGWFSGVGAAAFVAAAVMSVQPLAFWGPHLAPTLEKVAAATSALATLAVGWLAVRAWGLRSRARHVISFGVALVALRFGTSAFMMLSDTPGSTEGAAENMAMFLVDCLIASAVLVVGLVVDKMYPPAQGSS